MGRREDDAAAARRARARALRRAGARLASFAADPASTINVTVSADVPSNDIQVNLVFQGQTLHSEDTGVGQETFVYPVGATAGNSA